MKNFIRLFSHFVIWCIVLVVPIYFMSRGNYFDSKHYMFYLLKIGIIGILFYVNFLYLIEKLLFNKKIISYIIINIILIVILIGAQTILSDTIMEESKRIQPQRTEIAERNHIPPQPKNHQLQEFRGDRPMPRPPFFMRIISDYLLIVFVIGLSVAIKMTGRWYRDSINYEKIKAVQYEADLRNLRSQLNPHFLFNTLNNIYSLIVIDRDKAQDSVHRLSNLLRYILYDNDEKFVPIDKELEFTQNYIDLMKLRLGSSVKLNVQIEDNKGSKDIIASLLFMTLIENAFKHGINNDKDSFIDIKILVEKGKGVLCSVENSLNNSTRNQDDKNSGIGLTNLSKRLELLYPDKHEFTIEKRENSFFALLRIDF